MIVVRILLGVFLLLASGPSWSENYVYVKTGSSEVIDIAQPFGRFLIGNPDVLEVTPINESSFYILAKAPGRTTIQIFAANKTDLLQTLSVQTGPDLDGLKRAFGRLVPDAKVNVYFENTSLQLVGSVPDEEAKALIVAAAEGMTGIAPVNGLVVDQPRQVRLKVRFLEVSRSLNGDLGIGINLSGQSGNNSMQASTFSLTGGALGQLSIIDSTINIDLVLKALEEQGYAKFLAEPTLTALSGQDASFLAGGEVPVTRTDDAGKTETIYKEYGIKLNFKPVVNASGMITLTLAPEVSQVDFINLLGGMPTFTTRRASTTVEMQDNQSIVLAGLYQSNESRAKSAVPGLSNLPVIGALFRDSRLRGTESEIMIVITPALSFVTTKDDLALRKIENSDAATPDAFFGTGQIEAAGYDLRSLLDGVGITGNFGPMIHENGRGIFNGKN